MHLHSLEKMFQSLLHPLTEFHDSKNIHDTKDIMRCRQDHRWYWDKNVKISILETAAIRENTCDLDGVQPFKNFHSIYWDNHLEFLSGS